MYFEDLSMSRSINCGSVHQNGGFRSSEKIEPISAVCVLLVSRANFAVSLVNGIKRTQRGWKLKSCVEIKFM